MVSITLEKVKKETPRILRGGKRVALPVNTDEMGSLSDLLHDRNARTVFHGEVDVLIGTER